MEVNGESFSVQANQAFYIPAGASATYRTNPNDPWFYAWTGFFCDFRHPLLRTLFSDQYVIDLVLSAEEIESMIFSILEVTDERLKGITHYERNHWEGPQFHPIINLEQSLEANSRFFHLLSRLIQAQTTSEKNISRHQKTIWIPYAWTMPQAFYVTQTNQFRRLHCLSDFRIHFSFLLLIKNIGERHPDNIGKIILQNMLLIHHKKLIWKTRICIGNV